jgi:pSer/pThr/pTyr-binding forkhead associated (FHA) protein
MSPAILLLALRLLAAVALYLFLAVVVITIWREVRLAARQSEMMPAARLVVVEGPSPGQSFPLAEVNVLGRAAENAVRVVDETVSAYHARLWYQSGQWWLEDLGSRNGTRVNEVRVEQPLVLAYGDHLTLGRVCLELGRAEAPYSVSRPKPPDGS